MKKLFKSLLKDIALLFAMLIAVTGLAWGYNYFGDYFVCFPWAIFLIVLCTLILYSF